MIDLSSMPRQPADADPRPLPPLLRRRTVSRHRTYVALTWPGLVGGTGRAHRVALLGEVWDLARALALELVTPRALPDVDVRAAHADVCDELGALVHALAVPDPWAAVLAEPLPWLTVHAEIVWSPSDLTAEGAHDLRARVLAHTRWAQRRA